MTTSDPQFYERLERLLVRNVVVHIGNKSHWINLPELRAWAASKGYTVSTRHNNHYVKIS